VTSLLNESGRETIGIGLVVDELSIDEIIDLI